MTNPQDAFHGAGEPMTEREWLEANYPGTCKNPSHTEWACKINIKGREAEVLAAFAAYVCQPLEERIAELTKQRNFASETCLQLRDELAAHVRQQDAQSYVPQEVALDCLRILESSGFGKLGTPNTLIDMVKEAAQTTADLREMYRSVFEQGQALEERIAQLTNQVESQRTSLSDWLKENGPGGWIDNLRRELAAKGAENFRNLEMATAQHSIEWHAEHDARVKAERTIAAKDAEIARLVTACNENGEKMEYWLNTAEAAENRAEKAEAETRTLTERVQEIGKAAQKALLLLVTDAEEMSDATYMGEVERVAGELRALLDFKP